METNCQNQQGLDSSPGNDGQQAADSLDRCDFRSRLRTPDKLHVGGRSDGFGVLLRYALRSRESEEPVNDRFVLSKGHAAPLLYAAWAEAGAFPVERLKTLREFTSDLEGHPTPRCHGLK